jgi:hypothetical protein
MRTAGRKGGARSLAAVAGSFLPTMIERMSAAFAWRLAPRWSFPIATMPCASTVTVTGIALALRCFCLSIRGVYILSVQYLSQDRNQLGPMSHATIIFFSSLNNLKVRCIWEIRLSSRVCLDTVFQGTTQPALMHILFKLLFVSQP